MILILANPTAGQLRNRNATQSLNRAKDVLSQHDRTELVWLKKKGGATILAREAAIRGAQLVVSAGGDGTTHEIVNGLAGSETAFSLLPLGTENVLAKFLRLPLDPEASAAEILRRPKRQVDLGKVNNRYFLLFLGIGFDARVVKTTSNPLKQRIGGMAFALTALWEAWKRPSQKLRFRIVHDGSKMETDSWQMLVGNIPNYGWQLSVLPNADMADGKLDACLFPDRGVLGQLHQIASLLRERHLKTTAHFQSQKITVSTHPIVDIQADGEWIGMTPCEIQVAPKSLWAQF